MNLTVKELDARRVGYTGTMGSKSSLMLIASFGDTGACKKEQGHIWKELIGAVIAEGIGGLRCCYIGSFL